jgi:type I restriction enzyme S subunit
VKKGWEIKKLRQVCELVNGRAYSKPELLDSGRYRVLRVGNFFTNDHWYYSDLELEEKKYCDTGDLLYAWSASFGPRIWTGGKVIYHYHIWKVVHDCSRIDQRFLFYFFQWDTEKIKEDQGTGTTMMHVSMGSMNEREIPVPPLDEQHRIVALLDEAFEALATAKANAEQNLRNALAFFESHLEAVFSQKEEGWTEKRLAEFADFKNGLNFSRNSSGQTLRMVGVGDFQERSIVPLDKLQCTTIDGNVTEDYLIREGDILTVRSNGSKDLVGRCMLVPAVNEMISYSGFIIRIRPDGQTTSPRFLLYFMKSRTARSRLTSDGGGTSISNINQAKLATLPVLLPPLKKQEEIANHLDAFSKESKHLTSIYERKIAALEELKTSLLHQAFSGKI